MENKSPEQSDDYTFNDTLEAMGEMIKRDEKLSEKFLSFVNSIKEEASEVGGIGGMDTWKECADFLEKLVCMEHLQHLESGTFKLFTMIIEANMLKDDIKSLKHIVKKIRNLHRIRDAHNMYIEELQYQEQMQKHKEENNDNVERRLD